MKTKKKQKQMAGRSALMASLIVAAITGVTPAFAAPTHENMSSTPGVAVNIGADQNKYLKTTNVTIGALTVTGTSGALGTLYIGKNANSSGGNVVAQPNSTLTADNMTIEQYGVVEVSNNSTLKIVQNKALVEGTLTLNNGTVVIQEGQGTLQVAGSAGELKTVPGSVNTVKGSVLLGVDNSLSAATGNGKLTVEANSSLTITKDLTVNNGTAETSGTLVVNGTTSGLASGTIDINSGGQMTAKKSDFVSFDGTTATKVIGTTVTNDGTLYLTMSGIYTDTDVSNAKTALGNGTGTVAFLGGTWQGKDLVTGEIITTKEITAVTAGAHDQYLNNTVKLELGTAADVSVGDGSNATLLGAQTLETNATKLSVATKGTLQLTGTGTGGALITGGTAATKDIAVATGGTLELGIAGSPTAQGGKLQGIDNAAGGTVKVTDGNFSMTDFTNAGNVTIDSFGKNTTFTATNSELTDGQLKVLNSTANLGKLTASGGSIFIDPAIVTIDTIVGGKTSTEIVVGAGGNVVIGDAKADWMLAAMKNVGVASLDPDTSVLAVRETIKLAAGGQIYLDPTATDSTKSTTHDLTFNNGSLVIADMAKLNGGPIFDITNGDKKEVFIADGAKLYLSDLKFGNNGITLIKGATTITPGANGTGWTGENLINPDSMLGVTLDPTTGKLTVAVKKASDVMSDLTPEMNGLMDEVWRGDLNSVNSANAGIKLVSRAAHGDYMTPAEGARAVEGVARMAVLGATQQMAFATSNAATAAATQRTSMANPMANSSGTLTALVREEGSQQWKAENSGLSAGNGMKNGAALWIMPLYQNMNAWNMKADNFHTGYSANFGGVALGGDYTFADAFRLGLALNIGGGFSESNGDFAKTENKFNFWGINLYGGWAQNNLAVTADVGYTSTFNDVKQDSTPGLGMSEFKTDMYSHAITAGLRGEYKVQTEYVDIIPHIAAHFTNLHSDDYKIKSGGETVFKGEAIDQSIWTFPIGVAFSKDVEMSNGWTFKPQVDLAVIPAAGDIAAKTKVKIPGHSVSADLESNIVDGISYQGALGFDMYKDNIAFGLNYTIQASEHTTGHGVQATIRYEF